MKQHNNLDCFVLVLGGTVISPALTTTREYGAWFSAVFDNYTSAEQLYLKSKTADGNVVLESHPGTKIGKFFDTHRFAKPELNCWYLDPELVKQLISYKLADTADIITYKGARVLRVYTIEQIMLYVQSTVDRQFQIGSMVLPSKKVQVSRPDQYIRPEVKKRKTLF